MINHGNSKIGAINYGTESIGQVYYIKEGKPELVWFKPVVKAYDVTVNSFFTSNTFAAGASSVSTSTYGKKATVGVFVGGRNEISSTGGYSKNVFRISYTSSTNFYGMSNNGNVLAAPVDRPALGYSPSNFIVAGGGKSASVETYSDTVQSFNRSSLVTNTLPSLNDASSYMSGEGLGDKIIFVGGRLMSNNSPTSTVWRYSYTSAGTKTVYSGPTYSNGLLIRCGDSVIFAGGVSGNNFTVSTNRIYRISPSQTLTLLPATLLNSKHNIGGVTLSDGSALLIGGRDASHKFGEIEKISPTFVKTYIGHLQTPTDAHSCALLGSNVIIAGGSAADGATDRVEIRKTSSGVLVQKDKLSNKHARPSVARVWDRVYFYGGGNTRAFALL